MGLTRSRKVGRPGGWATASILLLLVGTPRAVNPIEMKVAVNGDTHLRSLLASRKSPAPVAKEEPSAEEAARAAAEIWTGFAKQEVEHAKSEGLKVQDVGKEHLPYLDRDVDHYYTANRIFDRVFESDMACPFLEYSRTAIVALPPNLTSTFQQRVPWAVPGVELPQELADMRPIPFEFGEDIKQKERPTYYWAFRIMQNLYYYAQSHWYGEPLLHIPGWPEQKAHFFHEDLLQFETFESTPMAMTIYNPDREILFLVIRGTLSRQEWYWDHQYNYAGGAARHIFPGRIHNGVFTVFEKLRESIMSEVYRLQPKKVVVTGHSLGGAMSIVFSWYIKSHFPHVPVDCLAFAPITTGDKTFFEAVRPAVNLRTIFFLGPGWDGDLFRAGDITPQPGHSAPLPGCELMDTGNGDDKWQYELPGGFIRFTSEEMPNPETWKKVEDTMFPTIQKSISAHVCAYLCWTAHPYDADSHCYFSDEKEGLPDGAYCKIENIVEQLIDNTGVNTRPLTPPNRKLRRGD